MTDWNFITFEKYINQRFTDLSQQLRERYEAQQIGVTAALAAAEKAVTAALTAAEKAVDKAEGAQQLRNESQNEFRKSLSDLSGLMWTTKEGQATVDSIRRELTVIIDGIGNKLNSESISKSNAIESLRKATEGRIGNIEKSYSNMQGRLWALGTVFGIAISLLAIFMNYNNKSVQPVSQYVPAPTAIPAPVTVPVPAK